MDFSLTKEQMLIKEMVRDFAQKEIRPYAIEWDRKAEFPYGVFFEDGRTRSVRHSFS